MVDYRGKWIWITGASSGLGKSLCMVYDKLNANLILSSRNDEKLKEVKDMCIGEGEKHIVPLDLEKYKKLSTAVEQVFSITDSLDVLINNGGVSQRSFALETEIDVSERLMDINFMGAVALTTSVLPRMIERGKGQIVAISSVTGKYGSPYRSTYAASKHALHGYFDSLRMEVENEGIDITLICPGFVYTNVSINAFVGDGSRLNSVDEKSKNGLKPDDFARRAFKAIHRKRKEVYIGQIEVLGVYLKRYFPALFRYVIRRSKVR